MRPRSRVPFSFHENYTGRSFATVLRPRLRSSISSLWRREDEHRPMRPEFWLAEQTFQADATSGTLEA
jgi:hypothetical protein